ncbi:D-2-hydroxyacid dehydrogenase [Puniceicoccaceae bacterium K14]|nr:D-2-hydroxyacid dehydrogenase [Puniceicoccaceae bacterium K14]
MPSILLVNRKGDPFDDTVRRVQSIAPGYKVITAYRGAPIPSEDLIDVEIAAGFGLPAELRNSDRLRWYHHNAAGVDWIGDYDNPESIKFLITNISGLHAVQITEHVFGMIHTLNRDMMQFHVSKNAKQWNKPRISQVRTLPGKTMLIVGLGNIGSRIAKIANAHGMQVLGIRRHAAKQDDNVDQMGTFADLESFVSRADITVSVLPNTPETQGIFSEGIFDLMKADSLFLNVGRGTHVDEETLADALFSGKLRGAGIDAFCVEPLPEESRLWEAPNLIISPHCSGSVPEYSQLAYDYFLKNLQLFLEGKPLQNLVNKSLGY